MTLRTRIAGAGTACIVAGALGLLPAASAHAASTSSAKTLATAAPMAQPAQTSVPVTGTTSVGTFAGSLSNLSTSVVNGVLTLTGTLTGTLTNSTTGVTTAVSQTFSTPLTATPSGGCTILTLNLGAIHLNVLGLVVDLAPVNLDVTAVPGAGNLLGNLLCAVTHLLDNGGPLQGISALLNRLLTGLGL
jgi:hypothetical protein